MFNCYRPLLNFIIFIITFTLFGTGIYQFCEEQSLKRLLLLIISFCLFIGFISLLFYYQDNNIQICKNAVLLSLRR